jgi:hypothetical protein
MLELGLTEEHGPVGWWWLVGPTGEEEASRMAWADLDHLGRLGLIGEWIRKMDFGIFGCWFEWIQKGNLNDFKPNFWVF